MWGEKKKIFYNKKLHLKREKKILNEAYVFFNGESESAIKKKRFPFQISKLFPLRTPWCGVNFYEVAFTPRK